MVGTIWGERASRVCVRQVSRKLRHATHHVSVEARDHTVATQPHSNGSACFFFSPPPLWRGLSETGSCYVVTQAHLKLVILLPQRPARWNYYRCAPP